MSNQGVEIDLNIEEDENFEVGSDYCHSVESYHSRQSDNDDANEDAQVVAYEGEFYTYDKDNPKMEVGAIYPNVVAFRRALNHYAILKDFEYQVVKSDLVRVTATCSNSECSWRIHASVSEDEASFIVKTLKNNHTCYGVNKRGNKHATTGWIVDRIIDDLRNEDIVAKELKRRLELKFGISIPYRRVWDGKEAALREIHGNWKDSVCQAGALRDELRRRNPGSVVELKTEILGGNHHFQRFFIALGACTTGFLMGCRPYICLDACHLKGKWKGVLAGATAIDGNNCIFPVAFAVMEGESEDSWEWFLRLLQEAIGVPEGLVLSSDMQKGLNNAIEKVYPLVEHRECMRHLYSNFKKHFRGALFKHGLWGAALTYCAKKYDTFIAEMTEQSPAAMQYLAREHGKLWSRSKFGTRSKCDYITNNIAETFNNWISKERCKPVIELLDAIRQKIMVRFNERRIKASTWKGPLVPKVANYIRKISRGLVGYDIHRANDFSAEITKKGARWAVNLEEQTCDCRAWQVKGYPCVHAAAFIASIRSAKWEDYIHSYYTVDRFKLAYTNVISPMPSKDKWVQCDLGYELLPPILKQPAGRPRKNRIKNPDEPRKRSHKCTRCGLYGHHRSTCKNAVPTQESDSESSQVIKKKRSLYSLLFIFPL